mmetsp:Transcript_32338/g.67460  ORF Transcript_32338/g.67460 Transcript_32338/m.67460 type:complete len:210 (-) Transcript_32338:1498-2127(-)
MPRLLSYLVEKSVELLFAAYCFLIMICFYLMNRPITLTFKVLHGWRNSWRISKEQLFALHTIGTSWKMWQNGFSNWIGERVFHSKETILAGLMPRIRDWKEKRNHKQPPQRQSQPSWNGSDPIPKRREIRAKLASTDTTSSWQPRRLRSFAMLDKFTFLRVLAWEMLWSMRKDCANHLVIVFCWTTLTFPYPREESLVSLAPMELEKVH